MIDEAAVAVSRWWRNRCREEHLLSSSNHKTHKFHNSVMKADSSSMSIIYNNEINFKDKAINRVNEISSPLSLIAQLCHHKDVHSFLLQQEQYISNLCHKLTTTSFNHCSDCNTLSDIAELYYIHGTYHDLLKHVSQAYESYHTAWEISKNIIEIRHNNRSNRNDYKFQDDRQYKRIKYENVENEEIKEKETVEEMVRERKYRSHMYRSSMALRMEKQREDFSQKLSLTHSSLPLSTSLTHSSRSTLPSSASDQCVLSDTNCPISSTRSTHSTHFSPSSPFVSFSVSSPIQINALPFGSLSYSDFLTNHANQSAPIIFSKAVYSMLPNIIWDLDFFQRELGHLTVPLKRTTSQSVQWAQQEHVEDMLLSEYIELIKTDSADDRYLVDWSISQHAPHILSQLHIPLYFAHDYLQTTPAGCMYRDSWPSLFIGPKHSRSNLHIDSFGSHFWMLLLSGRKKWIFYSHDQIFLLYPRYEFSFDPYFEFDPLRKWECVDAITSQEREGDDRQCSERNDSRYNDSVNYDKHNISSSLHMPKSVSNCCDEDIRNNHDNKDDNRMKDRVNYDVNNNNDDNNNDKRQSFSETDEHIKSRAKCGQNCSTPLAQYACSYEVIMNPGDLLFVPAGSPHCVLNLEPTVAISANYIDSSNILYAQSQLLLAGLIDSRSQELYEHLKNIPLKRQREKEEEEETETEAERKEENKEYMSSESNPVVSWVEFKKASWWRKDNHINDKQNTGVLFKNQTSVVDTFAIRNNSDNVLAQEDHQEVRNVMSPLLTDLIGDLYESDDCE